MEGNWQKMREALELAITIGDWCCASDDPLDCCEHSCVYQVEPHGEAGADCPWKKIRAALSKPPRNCDVGTAEEQDNRMDVYCQTRKCESCPLWDNVNNGVRCEFTWAQMPYGAEEGGAK